MAPSSDQNSTTPTPTDPELQLSLSPMGRLLHQTWIPCPGNSLPLINIHSPGSSQPLNELPFHRNLEQRGSDICWYSNPSTDMGCLESDDPNSQLASSGRLNHSPLPKEERQVPCTSPTSGTASMNASTSSTATHIEEYARRLQQCNVSGNTVRGHFSLLRLKRNQPRSEGGGGKTLHHHVLQPKSSIHRVRHVLAKARRTQTNV